MHRDISQHVSKMWGQCLGIGDPRHSQNLRSTSAGRNPSPRSCTGTIRPTVKHESSTWACIKTNKIIPPDFQLDHLLERKTYSQSHLKKETPLILRTKDMSPPRPKALAHRAEGFRSVEIRPSNETATSHGLDEGTVVPRSALLFERRTCTNKMRFWK